MKGDCNICANGRLPDMSRTCAECGLSRKNYKPMTNADCIRAMMDEELADYLRYYSDSYARYDMDWLDWLRQEYKRNE